MSNFEKPKVQTCKDCKKVIEWKDATNNSGKRWPFDLDGQPHFRTCEKRKPYISKCKFCQVEIDWKESKPFNKDGKSHFETCTRRPGTEYAETEPLF